MGDFVTAVKYALPDWETDLHNPDFAAFAGACGGEGHTVKKSEELEPALTEAFAAQVPTIIDIAVDPNALILPPEIKLSQAVGFSMAKLREIFSV